MDTDLLKTFLEVSRTRHFGKAADNLFLTRSAVSFRVKQLESTLGVELFERQRNNIQPTIAGERLISHAESILTALEKAKQDINLQQGSAQLSIALGQNIWDVYFKPFFSSLLTVLDDVSLHCETLSSQMMVKRLLDKNADLLISFDLPKLEELNIVKLTDIELCLVASKPISLEDCQKLAYVKVDWGTSFNLLHSQHFSWLSAPVLKTSSAMMALEYILQKESCAFLPKTFVQEHLTSKKLHMVNNVQTIIRPVYGAHWPDNKHAMLIDECLSHLTTTAQSD